MSWERGYASDRAIIGRLKRSISHWDLALRSLHFEPTCHTVEGGGVFICPEGTGASKGGGVVRGGGGDGTVPLLPLAEEVASGKDGEGEPC